MLTSTRTATFKFESLEQIGQLGCCPTGLPYPDFSSPHREHPLLESVFNPRHELLTFSTNFLEE